MTDQSKRRGLDIERVWIALDGNGVLRAVTGPRPCDDAVEYMRVMSRAEIERISEDLDVQQLLNSYLRTIEGQRREINRYKDWAASCEPAPGSARAAFKNFHRLLCERFGYAHDEKDWERDQLSLIEHIAKGPRLTLGKLILDTARGDVKARTLAPSEVESIYKSFARSPRRVDATESGPPTDGQLLDVLEEAFSNQENGYVEQDVGLRRTLAEACARFNRGAKAWWTKRRGGAA